MLNRHDLVFFNRNAIDTIAANAECLPPDAPRAYWDELFEKAGLQIPGIVRRQEHGRKGWLDVGFSSPRRFNGVRYRVSASIPTDDIEEVMTPFQVMRIALDKAKDTDARIIAELYASGGRNGVCVGLLGSRALQTVTGLRYAFASSDYDLIVEGRMDALKAYAEDVKETERRYGIVTDIEARICQKKSACDIKLEEWMSSSNWMMGKTISEVLLFRYSAGGSEPDCGK